MKWDGIKLSCVHASPLVHDVVRCFVSYFNFDYHVWHFQTQSNLQVHGMGEKTECKLVCLRKRMVGSGPPHMDFYIIRH